MKLDDSRFLEIIEFTPLVSIDLIISNGREEVLLGKRVNRPAMGYWFVPGGRIRKNERISDAIRRISKSELGVVLATSNARFIGVYEHIHDDNFFGQDGVNTHYVVLAYGCTLNMDSAIARDNQHSETKWWKLKELLDCPDVHAHTKAYFPGSLPENSNRSEGKPL